MIQDRPVYIGVSSGGVFTGNRANQPDFLTPYLSTVLGSMGLKSLQFFAIQATAFLDAEQAAIAREKALAAIDLVAVGKVRTLARVKRGVDHAACRCRWHWLIGSKDVNVFADVAQQPIAAPLGWINDVAGASKRSTSPKRPNCGHSADLQAIVKADIL